MNPDPNLWRYKVEGPTGTVNGKYLIKFGAVKLRVIASDSHGWDHVSVSVAFRIPTWQEMCHVKELFFGKDETVIQYHVAAADHINVNENCLHLWRPQTQTEIERIKTEWGAEWPWGDLAAAQEIPMPPRECV
jgi:hypothetical protein